MIGPSWLADVLAAVVIAVAVFSAARLIASGRQRRRRGEVDADGVHVLMGVAMAGMFVPRLATFPNPVWEVVFAGGALWFGWRTAQDRRHRSLADQPGLTSHPSPGDLASLTSRSGRASLLGISGPCCRYPLPHLVDCVAMLYMLWAIPAAGAVGVVSGAVSGGMSVMGGTGAGLRLPALGLVFVVCICIYVVWLGDRIQSFSAAPLAAAASGATSSASSASASRVAVHDHDRFPADSSGKSVVIMDDPPEAEADRAPGPGLEAIRPGLGAARRGPAWLQDGPLLAPRAATCCKIAMGVAMGVMLIDLL
jgi:hypothetical protein